MATDRELIEAAAKAAGMIPREFTGSRAYMDGLLERWNPLTSDADAFGLMVTLRIGARYNEALEQALAWVGGPGDFEASANIEDCGCDEKTATRRAITRAAAHIGGLTDA